MNNEQYTALWEKEAHKCSKCGKCRSFCPVFIETRDEKMGTRGRISLASAFSSGHVDCSPEFLKSISTCMRCLRCSKECPSKVDYDKLIRGVRGIIGINVLKFRASKNIIRKILLNRTIMDLLVFGGAVAQKLMPKGESALVKKLPFFYRGISSSPRFAAKSVLKQIAGTYKVENPKHRVMFYVGCVINYCYPDIARSVVEVLNHHGVEVVIAKKELCCGIPAISYGDYAAAKELARKNIKAASDLNVDYIISACSTCVNTLKKDYDEILGEEAAEFSSKVLDISYFLNNIVKADFSKIQTTVTYHDPCHMKFGLGITKEPRSLISKASNFVEMKMADKCCGMAGCFGIMNRNLSSRIFEKKAHAVKDSEAGIVATGCPSCIMQIRGQLAERGMNVEVMHTVELLNKSIKNEKKHRIA